LFCRCLLSIFHLTFRVQNYALFLKHTNVYYLYLFTLDCLGVFLTLPYSLFLIIFFSQSYVKERITCVLQYG
jgi:hypothetical protein